MRKGLIVALLLVTFAWFGAQNASAVAPVVGDPGDFVIGGAEPDDDNSTGTWVFVNAFDLRDQALDDALAPDQLLFSFTHSDADTDPILSINGVGPLNPDGIGFFEDDPTSPNAANLLNGTTLDEADVFGVSPWYAEAVDPAHPDRNISDDDGWTVTIRNTDLSPEGGPNATQAVLDSMDVDADGNFTTSTVVVSLFASDGASFGSSSFVVFSSAEGGDTGGLFTLEDPGPTNFAEGGNPPDADAWIALDFAEFGSDAILTSAVGTGLCIFVTAPGENIGQWEMPRGNAIELTKNKVYRVRFAMSTDQNNAGAQPVWNILMSNLDSTTGKIIYGSERWFFDNTAGANGIGIINRAGFTELDAYLAPNALQTDAWNGVAAEDNPDSPFDDSALNAADAAFQVSFRVLDLDSAIGINAVQDSGTTCLRSVTIQSIDRDSLTPLGTVFGSASFVPDSVTVDTSFSPDAITSDNGATISVSLDEQPSPDGVLPGIGRAFIANGSFGDGFVIEFPIAWNDAELLCLEAEIRATGGTGDKPVDVIATGWQTATNEIGGTDFMFRGQPGDVMDKAGSPRATGNSTYTSYFWTHHQTDINQALLPDSQRLRAIVDLFNRTDLVIQEAGDGILSDQLTITSFHVQNISTAGIDSPADGT